MPALGFSALSNLSAFDVTFKFEFGAFKIACAKELVAKNANIKPMQIAVIFKVCFCKNRPKNGFVSPSAIALDEAIKAHIKAPKYVNFLSNIRNFKPHLKTGLLLIWHFLSYPDCGMIYKNIINDLP